MGGMTRTSPLSPGDSAPDFRLDSTHGEITLHQLLSSQREGVILYFYPKASTPGCTTQACDFRDSLDALNAAGYQVVGISPDTMDALKTFRDEQQLTYILASDPDHLVLEEYGAWGEKQNYGKTSVGVIRSTVVIHPDGTVALAQYNVKATGHVARLRRELGLD